MIGIRTERILTILAIAVSLALTSLTVLAVMRQGETILEQRANLLRQAAADAARKHQNDITVDLTNVFERAVEFWNNETIVGLDLWAADTMNPATGRRGSPWRIALFETRRNEWITLPFAPLQVDAPATVADLLPFPDHPGAVRFLDDASVERLETLAQSDAVGPRVFGLIGLAARDRSDSNWAGAAARLLVAGMALEGEPRYARQMFGVRLARVDVILQSGDTLEALHELTRLAERYPPWRTSWLEAALVQQRADRIRDEVSALRRGDLPETHADDDSEPDSVHHTGGEMLESMLTRMRTNARIRAEFTRASEPLRAERIAGEGGESVRFVTLRRSATNPRTQVVAIGQVAGRRIALVAAATDVIETYWGPQDFTAEWRVVLADETPLEDRIFTLGHAFGNAVITETPESVNRANELQIRQLSLLVFSAAGSAAGWGVVIWLMLGVMARQRELVQLQRRFVADVSHELKTPLALIRLLAETLASGRLRESARVDHYLSTITRESERLSALIDNILDFSNMEAGRKRYEFGPCSVNMVVQQAWALFEPQFAKDGFLARLIVQPDMPTIRADGAALQQLVVNLLQNAYRYGAEGKYVALSAQRVRNEIVIEVEDHGIGMTRKQIQRIGQSFYRADDPRVRKTRGTGLGLTIVKHIIAAHGGQLEIQSKPGKGSVFSVRIPIRDPAQHEPGA